GRQFSVEMLSQDGKHEFIGLTEEFYSGPPYFVEENYITPGRLKDNLLVQLIEVVSNSLDAINYKNGASHIEIRINDYNEFCIIEIAGRMGATRSEFIEIAYGIDYMKALLNVAMNEDYELKTKNTISFAYMKLIKNERELELLNKLSKAGDLEYYGIKSNVDKTAEVVNMTKAWGYFIKKEDTLDKCLEYINYWYNEL
ncbi:MAG: ATP-grasp domain-containing protein, partial [Mycoplasmataceae bacterium]|nr:ATP-grasp domain-containing protein [Mycoplasmataceae bacterium]